MKEDTIKEIVQAFEDAARIKSPMEARMPLYRVDELKKQMSEEEFYTALKQSVLNLLNKNLTAQIDMVLDLDKKLISEPVIASKAKECINKMEAEGMETQHLKELFKI